MIGHQMIGDGPEKVIVLHGWVTDHASAFAPTIPYLDKETFTYAFLDYRGYGRSKDQAGEHTIAEIGTDALELAAAHGWDRFHLVGHSMGGLALQWVAVQVPERVKCGVAINPVPASGLPLEGDFLTLFESAADTPANRGRIAHITTGSRHTPAWEQVMTDASLATTTRDAVADYLQAWMHTNFAAPAAGCPVPLLVLVGEHDPAITADFMRQTIMQWFPNAELTIMPNAGHYPMMEVPIYLATTIEAFLRQHAGG
jgi:pimeloyl-ACP methyl ester carboxylesterase